MIKTNVGPIMVKGVIRINFDPLEITNIKTGKTESLTKMPSKLFKYLLKKNNTPCTVSSMVNELWNIEDEKADPQNLYNHLKKIRRAIKDSDAEDYISIKNESAGKYNIANSTYTLLLNESDIKYLNGIDEDAFDYRLWFAERRDFYSRIASKKFGMHMPLDSLLPRTSKQRLVFDSKYREDDGSIKRIDSLISETNDHLSLIGPGGIGKTTTLFHILLGVYGNDMEDSSFCVDKPVPVYVELNQCPSTIEKWYDESLHKTNFITRYIACVLEGHQLLDSVSYDTLVDVEKNLQISSKDSPHILLLLDGFNEVSSSADARSQLCKEISKLSEYNNVRIISTSRETKNLLYSDNIKEIQLIGLPDDDIISHLKSFVGFDKDRISEIKSNPQLLDCLRIPLYLQLYCHDTTGGISPTTKGEILYRFFHTKNSVYDLHTRDDIISSNPLNHAQTHFVLYFTLPYIGWFMDEKEIFSISEKDLIDRIDKSIEITINISEDLTVLPFSVFNYDIRALKNVLYTLKNDPDHNDKIISCIYDALGIMYFFTNEKLPFGDRRRFSFGHHQYRDYFSAMWDIHMLTLLPCTKIYPPESETPIFGYNDVLDSFVNQTLWKYEKADLISQILSEHRNLPEYDKFKEQWIIPKADSDERSVLSNAIDFCRKVGLRTDFTALLRNVLKSIKCGRGELSGINLSGLELTGCNFNETICSRYSAKTDTWLSVDFTDSKITEKSFSPETHADNLLKIVYTKEYSYSLDYAGHLMCWDLRTGTLQHEWQLAPANEEYDDSNNNPDWFNANHPATTVLKASPDLTSFIAVVFSISSRPCKDTIMLYRLYKGGGMSDRTTITDFMPAFNDLEINDIFYTSTSDGFIVLHNDHCITGFDIHSLKRVFFSNVINNKQHNITDLYMRSIYDQEIIIAQNKSEIKDLKTLKIQVSLTISEINIRNNKITKLYNKLLVNGNLALKSARINDADSIVFYSAVDKEYYQYNYIKRISASFGDKLSLPDNPDSLSQDPLNSSILYISKLYEYVVININNLADPFIVSSYSALDTLPTISWDTFNKEIGQEPIPPCNNKALLFSNACIYEWNMPENTVSPRYFTMYDQIVYISYDASTDQIICANSASGIYVLDGRLLRVKYTIPPVNHVVGSSYYYYLPNAKKIIGLYQNFREFEIDEIDINTGIVNCIFSDRLDPYDSIRPLSIKEEKKILIQKNVSCYEYDLSSHTKKEIYKAKEGSILDKSKYTGSDIEIVIIELTQLQSTVVSEPRCYRFAYNEKNDAYTPVNYYICPDLREEKYNFVYNMPELFFKEDNLNRIIPNMDYFIFKGFFVPGNNSETFRPQITIKDMDGNDIECVSFPFYDEIYVSVSASFQTIAAYLSITDTEGILSVDTIHKRIKLHDIFIEEIKELEDGLEMPQHKFESAYYSIMSTYQKEGIIFAQSQDSIIILDPSRGINNTWIHFNNRIHISGCDFSGCIMNPETEKLITESGGFI